MPTPYLAAATVTRMWKMLFFLWSVPILFGLAAAVRSMQGESAMDEKMRRRLFGASEDLKVSPATALEFLALAIVFFVSGLFEALVLVNFGNFWLIAAPMVTGLAAVMLLAYCVRRGEPRFGPHRTWEGFQSLTKRFLHLISDLPAHLHEKH